VVEQAKKQGMQVHIPARKNRKNPREYDKHLYRQRHLVENAFAHIRHKQAQAGIMNIEFLLKSGGELGAQFFP